VVDYIDTGIGHDEPIHIDCAFQALSEIQRRIERLKLAAEKVWFRQDSNTLADLDTALNVLESGNENCR
jgi:hypothetical protein